jgi:hypothetical protein
MNQHFDDILDQCLSRIKAGESFDACLSDFPEQAELLKPLLLAADQVRSVPRPRARPRATVTGREGMLAVFNTLRIREKHHKQAVSFDGFSRYTQRVAQSLRRILFGKDTTKMKLAVRIAFDVLVILMIGGYMTMNAAARSLPGDPTYGVKRAWEQVRMSLTLDEQARQRFENHLIQERRDEVRALMKLGRQETVEFSGVLEHIEGDQWTVDGLAVQIAGSATIEGTPARGQAIRILAHVQNNGTLLAVHVGPEDHHSLPDVPNLYPAHDVSATPGPRHDPARQTEPAHMPDHDASPMPTATRLPGTTSAPIHIQETEQSAEPLHEPEPTHEIEHQAEPTQQVEPSHEPQRQPEPAHHDEPPHDSEQGHPDEPHHDGDH